MSGAEVARRRAEDAASRLLACREFDRPVVIEAGAGTGKTATLVARVLAWCLGAGWERALAADPDAQAARTAERVLRGVVAITFTEAAAAEMETRIDDALAEVAGGGCPVGFEGFQGEVRPERVAALRGALDQLAVQTIHAYCRRLLTSFPIEAGLHPHFEVDADGSALEAAVREAVTAQLGSAYTRGDEAALDLAESGVGPFEIEEELLVQLRAGASAAELAADPLASHRLRRFVSQSIAAHETFAAAAGDRLEAVKRGSKARAVAAALAAARTCLGEPVADAPGLERLLRGLGGVWSGSAIRALKSWTRTDGFSGAESAAFGDRCDAIREAADPLRRMIEHAGGLDLPKLVRVAPLLASLAADVEERLRRRGRVGFDGLLRHCAALLEQHPAIAAQLRGGIDQLLVDEFQDTDARQCAIVAALALTGAPDDRPGLFLVGDPKQSIYGWRNADLGAYEALLARVKQGDHVLGPLSVNHRSVPAILGEVDRVVAPVMRREEGLQPAFEGLAPGPALESQEGFSDGGRAPVEFWISATAPEGRPSATRAAEAAALEAEALARDLRELHDRHGVAWSDVGLLFRSRGEWDVYLGALREWGVPYTVEGDRTYYRRREILDAASFVACVLDPNDQVALVGSLRSSLAGVPDAAWIPLWEGGLPGLAARLGEDPGVLDELEQLLEAVAVRLPGEVPGLDRLPGWQRAAFAHLESVAALRASFESEPGDRFVERLRAALCLEGVEASRFAGAWRAANLERLFAGLAEDLAAGQPQARVLRRLRRAVAEEETPSTEPASHEDTDAVNVLTLHGAKGLAWNHVYLMQLHKSDPPGARQAVVGRVEGELEARWCGARTLACHVEEERRARVSAAERVRTLYVGMTRARQRLVLCGLWPCYQEHRSGGSHTVLLTARNPAPPDLDALARRALARGGRANEAGALWVFPALWPEYQPTTPVAEPAQPEAGRAAPVAAKPVPGGDARMALPAGAAVSELAAVAESAVEGDRDTTGHASGRSGDAASHASGRSGDAARHASGRSGDAARHAGTAIHAALERLDLEAPDPEAEWERQREQIAVEIERELPADPRGRARADALECWDALGRGPLAARLRGLGPDLVARELPLLLHPRSLPEGFPAEPATGAVGGAIDLLYRDADGRLVIVDYKTDRREGESGAPERYARQGALYRHAVAQALGDERPPRFEIWWLRSGRAEAVDAPA